MECRRSFGKKESGKAQITFNGVKEIYMAVQHGVQTTTIDSNSKTTGVIDIFGCNRLAVEVQTCSVMLITATANVYIQVCDTSTGTFRRLQTAGIYSAGAAIADFEIPTTTGNRFVTFDDAAGFHYAKVEFSNTCTATATIRVHKIM